MPSLRLQSIFYQLAEEQIGKLFECLALLQPPAGWTCELYTGDCSTVDPLSNAFEAEWRTRFSAKGIAWEHTFFGRNIGFGAGHNTLSQLGTTPDHILLMNPDCYYPANLLAVMGGFASRHSGYGMVEARQIPLEHPKTFDEKTLQTNWCSCCCALINGSIFRQVEGFDELFFLYGEDVDLSWRIAGVGGKLYYCPEAFVYHAKHLGLEGMEPAGSETLYSALATLLLYRKYGQDGHLKRFTAVLEASDIPEHAEAVKLYSQKAKAATPAPQAARAAAIFSDSGGFGGRAWEYVGATASRPDRVLQTPLEIE